MNIKPRNEIIQALKDSGGIQDFMVMPWGESCLDHRDIDRLLRYLTYDEAVEYLGDVFKEGAKDKWGEPQTWDEETVTQHIRDSLEFAFEKALEQRGISAGLMHTVMLMWLWVMQDQELLDECHYTNYGLPYLYRIRDKHFPDMEVAW